MIMYDLNNILNSTKSIEGIGKYIKEKKSTHLDPLMCQSTHDTIRFDNASGENE